VTEQLKQLEQLIPACMVQKRFALGRKISKVKYLQKEGKPFEDALFTLSQDVVKNVELAQARLNSTPVITFDDSLPISQKRDDIRRAIDENQVVVIAGETGSGKTTQIPKICLELGLAQFGLIAHTQPRRIAARSVAQRISEEVKVELGNEIGYQIRFSDNSNESTLVKLMTDGILLAETQYDKFLNKYSVIIIDEAHERSLNIDFLLGYLKQLIKKRKDLKVIITSATIDVSRFSKHFDNAPTIEVSGRTFPVETLYRPLLDQTQEKDDNEDEGDLYQGILQAVEELELEDLKRKQMGDVLVFLSGEREIREASLILNKAAVRNTIVLPLYARLNNKEQNKIFNPISGMRRIILATNVAETSLTVPGIRYVIDSGVARISRYSYRSKVQRLPIEAISQASANQRKGRCGRVSEGICIRLYSEEDFNGRPEFSDPEIQRTNLAAVILKMLSLKLGDVTEFPFLDAPDNRFVKDGYNLLKELGAVSASNTINDVGRALSRLPVDPRIGRMLVEAGKQNCLSELMIIASALSIQDPRERPQDKKQAADQKHAEFKDEDSDFVSLINLWNRFEEERQASTNGQLRNFCKKNFLNYMRMREWRDVHHQLKLQCKDLKLTANTTPASYATTHQAILSGMLSHVGQKSDENDYKGARNRRFLLFPGSGIFKKRPKWVVSAELVETTKLYARMNAKIEPEWLEPLAKDLIKQKYMEPYWSTKRAQVMAYEQVSLFGLVIVPKRAVNFANIDEKASHEIFVREALVQGNIRVKGDFLKYNQKLIEQLGELEDKSRRRDIVVDEERMFEFYSERVAAHICSTATFEKWYQKQDPNLLKASKSYLMQHGAENITEDQYPDHFSQGSVVYPLTYRFEPLHREDGVSVSVPAAMLKQLPVSRLQWLVPGMIREKVIALVRSLNKPIRKQLVPVPDFVDDFLAQNKPCDQPLSDVLSQFIYKTKRIKVTEQDWNVEQVDKHFLMNIKVLGSDNRLLAQGRDWRRLLDEVGDQANAVVQIKGNDLEREGIKRWDLSDFPETYELEQAGIQVTLYPALIDAKTSVNLKLMERKDEADVQSRLAIFRLLQLELPEQVTWIQKEVQKRLVKEIVYYANIGNKTELLTTVSSLVFKTCFNVDELPRNEAQFNAIKEQGRSNIGATLEEVMVLIKGIMSQYHLLNKQMKQQNQLAFAFATSDIKYQIGMLMPKGFLAQIPFGWLKHYPRYIKAMMTRLNKLQGNLQKDKLAQLQVVGWQEQYQALLAKLPADLNCYPEVLPLNWMMQEFRVSLFAQELGTSIPISQKRWAAQLAKAQQSLHQ